MTRRAEGPQPSVGVVIPTRNRPELLRGAVSAALAQAYAGRMHVVVVYDGSDPDTSLVSHDQDRAVQVIINTRTTGLAGARNSGILALDTTLVAFCDDDDEWLPGKLQAQVDAFLAHDTAEMVSCSIVVEYQGASNARLAGTDVVSHQQLVRSRMAMLHSSTFLVDRSALLNDIGLIDEGIPGGQNEDWDLLLRASARRPIMHVDRPLVRIRWGDASYFARQWTTKISSLEWMLTRHRDIGADSVGAARVYGQLAFAHACLGQRRAAKIYILRALRRRPTEWRAIAALLVWTRIVSGETILRRLHHYGRGV